MSLQTIESVASEVTKKIANKYCYFSLPQLQEIERVLVNAFTPLVQQPPLPLGPTHDDQKAFEGQSASILKLLQQRRSLGAFNYELAELSLKYT